ncbi:hypothetical protein PTKIN_Ptkin09bG0238900 [Pterospermum kingtungense]
MGFEKTSSFSSDWDQNFTEQVIQSMDAIEATLKSSSSSSSPSSFGKKRKSTTHQENNPKTRRQLPASIVSPPRSFPVSFSRCQAYSRFRYPPLRFGGQILYSCTEAEVEKAAMGLLKFLELKKKEMGHVSIGFDIEWKPSFQRGVLPGRAAVMQICCDNRYCYVMHIIHSGIPRSLQVLLEDCTIMKVGVAIDGDAVKVFNDYNVSVKALEDLSHLAKQKLDRDRQNWGLAALTETLVCKELPKPKRIRLGNWELYPLSKEQLQYAATDAFASWHLYQVLKSLPDAVNDPADTTTEGTTTQ